MFRRWSALLTSAVLLGGCAPVPTGPSVMVLPGLGKSFEQFNADDAVCRQWGTPGYGNDSWGSCRSERCGERCRRHRRGGRRWRGNRRGSGGSRDGRGSRRRRWSARGLSSRGQRRAIFRAGSAMAIRHVVSTVHVREGPPDSWSSLRISGRVGASSRASARYRTDAVGQQLDTATAPRAATTAAPRARASDKGPSAGPFSSLEPALRREALRRRRRVLADRRGMRFTRGYARSRSGQEQVDHLSSIRDRRGAQERAAGWPHLVLVHRYLGRPIDARVSRAGSENRAEPSPADLRSASRWERRRWRRRRDVGGAQYPPPPDPASHVPAAATHRPPFWVHASARLPDALPADAHAVAINAIPSHGRTVRQAMCGASMTLRSLSPARPSQSNRTALEESRKG